MLQPSSVSPHLSLSCANLEEGGGEIGLLSPSSSCSSSNAGGGGGGSSPHFEAAVRYSFALHEHTRKMWEKERSNIERAKLGGGERESETSSMAPSARVTSSTTSSSEQSNGVPNRRSSLGSALGVDALWNRKKREHVKNSASIY